MEGKDARSALNMDSSFDFSDLVSTVDADRAALLSMEDTRDDSGGWINVGRSQGVGGGVAAGG